METLMPKIKLSASLVSFLDPLQMSDYYSYRDLWSNAFETSRNWINFGLEKGLSLEEIVMPFGISELSLDKDDATAAMAAIWINAYLDASIKGGLINNETH
jgi:hypothetical protein